MLLIWERNATGHQLKLNKNKSKVLVLGSKERLFIRTQTHNLQIFRVIPFVKVTKRHLNNRQTETETDK